MNDPEKNWFQVMSNSWPIGLRESAAVQVAISWLPTRSVQSPLVRSNLTPALQERGPKPPLQPVTRLTYPETRASKLRKGMGHGSYQSSYFLKVLMYATTALTSSSDNPSAGFITTLPSLFL